MTTANHWNLSVDRELHTDGKHENHEDHAGDELGSTGEVELLLGPTKGDSDEGEQDGDGTSAAGGIGLGEVDGTGSSTRSVNGRGEHERLADHVGEGGDDDDAEQPAEQQEQATAGLADVLLDELGEDLPLFFIEAYRAPKSWTAPKKMPPTRTQSTTGSQPKAMATIVPVTGPAPQIELNWCENAVKAETGEKLLPSFMRLAGVRASLSTPHLLASQRP